MKKIIFSLALFVSLSINAQVNEEYARYDPATSTWSFRMQPYLSENNTDWVNYQYVEQNNFTPKVKSMLRWNGREFAYSYRISNNKSSKQTINYLFATTPLTLELPDDTAPSAEILNTNPVAMREWQLKLKARRVAERTFERSLLSKPTGWRRALEIDTTEIGFGWFPEIEPYGPGVPPGRSVGGFQFLSTELPGVVLGKMQGRVDEPALPDGYRLGGPVEQAIDKILENDAVFAPILAPAIMLPTPYNGVELAKRIKTHVATWIKLGLITQDTLDRLNRNFDALIAAQTYNNIAGTQAAVREILQEAYVRISEIVTTDSARS